MKLGYYGAEKTGVHAVNNDYPGIDTPQDLYIALQSIWCEYSCSPRLRPEWSRDNKSLGQCTITAFLAQDIFGGKVYGIPRGEGVFHCYNEADGVIFDIASEQFGDEKLVYDCSYEQKREDQFADAGKKERYEYLCSELHKYCSAE